NLTPAAAHTLKVARDTHTSGRSETLPFSNTFSLLIPFHQEDLTLPSLGHPLSVLHILQHGGRLMAAHIHRYWKHRASAGCRHTKCASRAAGRRVPEASRHETHIGRHWQCKHAGGSKR